MPKKTIIVSDIYQQLAYVDRKKFDVFKYDESDMVIDTDRPDKLYVNMTSYGSGMEGCRLGGNYIVAPRFKDVEQLSILKRFGIYMPRILHALNLEKLYTLLEDNKTYIVKYFGHARSLGQAVVSKENLVTFVNDGYKCTAMEFADKYDTQRGVIRGDEERTMLLDNLRSGHCFLQEVVHHDEEYRVLVFFTKSGTSFMVEKREGYNLGSTLSDRKHYVAEVPDDIVMVCGMLQKVVNTLRTPAIAFDLFIKRHRDGVMDTWGIFEFSTEFGCDYPGHEDTLCDKITKAFEDLFDTVDLPIIC